MNPAAMTIEETTAAALRASTAGDLEALQAALQERAVAIRELLCEPPSEKLAARIRNAIDGGEYIQRDVRAIQQRIAYLRNVQAAPRTKPRIDAIA